MKKIPKLLIYSRIVSGIVILLLSIYTPLHFQTMVVVLVFWGLVSDIFDGISARRFNISTSALRRLDSGVDQFFWLAIIASCYIISPAFFKNNYLEIVIISALEGLCYVISYIKFKKEVATHAIASKIWTLILFVTLIQLIATGNSNVLFKICFYLGVLTRLEIIVMQILIKSWTNDIPTVYHAFLLINNKAIKRHKLFNG